MKTIKIVAFVLLVGVMSAFTYVKSNTGYQVGDIATDFSLKNVYDKNVTLSDFKESKGFIVVFT